MENTTEQKPLTNCHIVYTPFTGVGLHGGYRGDEWFKHRIEIFKNYTLKSLLNQTNKSFVHWLSFRPEEKNNPIFLELIEYLKTLEDYKFVVTYHNLIYHDDKFTNYTLKTKLKNFLQMWHDNLKQNPFKLIKFVWENKNDSLLERLTLSLQEIASIIGTEYQWVYLTRIDSDDMFHKDAIDLIQRQDPSYKKALVFDKGYIINIKTGQLADWNPPTNPPFHTIIFTQNSFFHPQSHLDYYGNFESHEDITTEFEATTLDNDKYMVAYQGKHISTDWNTGGAKKIYHNIKFKGYCYTSGSGRNISTHWSDVRTGTHAFIGKEYEDKEFITNVRNDFGV